MCVSVCFFLKKEVKATLSSSVLAAFCWCWPHGNECDFCLRSSLRHASKIFLLQIFSSMAGIMQQPSNRIRFTHSATDRYAEGLMKIYSFENIIYLLVAVFLSLRLPRPLGEVTEQWMLHFPHFLSPITCEVLKLLIYVIYSKESFWKTEFSWTANSNHKGGGLRIDLYLVCQEFGKKNAKFTPSPKSQTQTQPAVPMWLEKEKDISV